MFSPLRMRRLTLLLMTSDLHLATQILADHGMFAPVSRPVDDNGFPTDPARIYRIHYTQAHTRLHKALAHLHLDLPDQRPATIRVVSRNELATLDAWLARVWEDCSRAEERLRRLTEDARFIDHLDAALDNFEALDIDLSRLRRPGSFLDLRAGIIPLANLGQLHEAVELAGYVLHHYLSHAQHAHILLAGPASGGADPLQAVLASAEFRALTIPPELHDRPQQVRAELDQRRVRIAAARDRERVARLRRRDNLRERLLAAGETLALAAPMAAMGPGARSRGGLSMLDGWVPAARVAELEDTLHTRLPHAFLFEARAPQAEELSEVPTALREFGWLRPFTRLVKQFGIPRYGEVDPSLLFALSYIALFGMMFGDIGHGALIALAGYALRARLRGFAPFVISLGGSSMLFGVLYGSVFGYEEILHPLWISPLSDPILMLTVAVYSGIGFVTAVTAIGIRNRYLDGQRGRALFDGDGTAGLVLYFSLILGLRSWFQGTGFGAGPALVFLLALGIILAYRLHAQTAPWAERLLTASIEMIETLIGFVANTLSFLRVAAFSLNHVALALAIFAMAERLSTPGHWAMVVFGNLFVLVLEGAIVAIQALRLEYYEGFSRFFTGDGREFRPLTIGAGALK